jgi:adenylate kinase
METQTFVFFGIVGSGKGTQVKLLMEYLKAKDGRESVYAGTGDGFRKLLETNNFTAKIVKENIERGALQPDFLTTSVFANILIKNLGPEKHLFADGYPRTVVQSEALEKMMQFYERSLVKIIYIEVGKEEATKRMKLRARPDDTDEGIANRFDEYIKNVIPSMHYFKGKLNYEIYEINGEQSVEDVHQEIIKKLNF